MHYGDFKWPSWRLQLPAIPVFVHPFVQTNNNGTAKVRVTLPLWGESPPVSGGFPSRGLFH